MPRPRKPSKRSAEKYAISGEAFLMADIPICELRMEAGDRKAWLSPTAAEGFADWLLRFAAWARAREGKK